MLYRISNEAFEDSFLFETIPQALFDQFIGQLGKGSRTVVTRPCPRRGTMWDSSTPFTDRHFSLPGRRPRDLCGLEEHWREQGGAGAEIVERARASGRQIRR